MIVGMRRSLLEWGTLLFGLLAICCLCYWAMSTFSHYADFKVSLAPAAIQRNINFEFSNGTVGFSDDPITLARIDDANYGWQGTAANPNHSYALRLPGIKFRRIVWPMGSSEWAMSINLLIPFAMLSAITTILFRRYHRLRRAAVDKIVIPTQISNLPVVQS